MSSDTGIRNHVVARGATAAAMCLTATVSMAQSIGNPMEMSLPVRRAAAAQNTQPAKPLTDTYWKAIELAGKAIPAQDASREAHLQFQAGGRVSGSDGCNRMTGPYTLNGDSLTFGRMAATQMACTDASGTEQAFRDALEHTSRFRISGDRLELFNDAGTRLAAFAARP
jgi:heat shock protein HslJ